MSDTTAVTCAFPECDRPAAPPPATGGRSRYCDDPEHNATTAFRARRARGGVTSTEAETEQPVTMARVTGAELLRQMRELAGTMTATADRLTTAVATIGDTTAAEAEVESARAAAERRAATAEDERAAAERRAIEADQFRAQADDAAEEMSAQRDAAEARAREALEQLAEAAAVHAAEAGRIREETQARIGIAEEDRDRAIAARDAAVEQAEADKAAARAEADERVRLAEAQAQEQIERARAEAEAQVRAAE